MKRDNHTTRNAARLHVRHGEGGYNWWDSGLCESFEELCYGRKESSPRTSLKRSYGQSWFDTPSIGVECDTVIEGLEDYKNPVKALPRAVWVPPALRYRRRSLLWTKTLSYKNLVKQGSVGVSTGSLGWVIRHHKHLLEGRTWPSDEPLRPH
jgi:hypothetical protein